MEKKIKESYKDSNTFKKISKVMKNKISNLNSQVCSVEKSLATKEEEIASLRSKLSCSNENLRAKEVES